MWIYPEFSSQSNSKNDREKELTHQYIMVKYMVQWREKEVGGGSQDGGGPGDTIVAREVAGSVENSHCGHLGLGRSRPGPVKMPAQSCIIATYLTSGWNLIWSRWLNWEIRPILRPLSKRVCFDRPHDTISIKGPGISFGVQPKWISYSYPTWFPF